MRDFYLTVLVRTEHAKAVRRRTGTNDFQDKEWVLVTDGIIRCIGTTLTKDNAICVVFR